MEKEVHGENCHERGEEGWWEWEYEPGDGSHDGTEEDECDDSTFYELLDVPTLGDVIILGIFYFPAIDRIFGEFHDVAVGWSGGSESLSHRMFAESFDSRHSAVEMPLRWTGSENDSVNSSFVSEVKKSGKYEEKEYDKETFFFIFSPDGSEGKYYERETPEHDSDECTSWIGEENKSK